MSDFLSRIASLPPEKQRQLLRKIEEEGGAANAFPLSFSQERLWFLDQLAPGGALYNLPAVLRFSGRLDLAALAGSRNEVVRRHESLRTAFPSLGGQPIQVVLPFQPQPQPLVDLSALPAARREAEARALVHAETLRPFQLARGPLLRTVLLRLDGEDHVLVLTMHHIVSDAWSIGVLLGELATHYETLRSGSPSPLPAPRVQLRDFILWQRRQLQGDRLEAEIEHWRQRLRGAPAELDLPADRPRPPMQSYRGASWPFRVPRETAEAARRLASRHGATLFMTLLAAFEALLLRYTGREDMVLGTVVAQRDRPELEGLIGFLINTLVLRTDLSVDPPAAECLERIRETVLEAHAHQDLPFEKLVEALQPERSLGRSPLFQVAFGLQTLPPLQLSLPGLELSALDEESRTAKFDLRLSMVDTKDGLEGAFEYSTDLFDGPRIGRMADHLCRLLAAMVEDPGQPLSRLDLLTREERHQLQYEWNDTAGGPAWQGGAHERFARQAERTPDHPAVVFEKERLTYRELERRANLLAAFLRQRGLAPESLVGVCLERSTDLIVSALGVLKAGAAYLPLDPTNPPDRLASMIEDSRASFVLTRRGLDERLPPTGAERLWLDEGWEARLGASEAGPAASVEPQSLAYVIYTSGSTGRPKGVWLTHAGLCHHVDGGVQPGERALQFSSPGFDASVSEIFMTLLHGRTLVLARQEAMLPGPSLTALLRDEAVDMLTIPPSALAVLPEEPLPGLRILIVAGEACGAELVERWGRGRQLFNAYGPTEASVCATYRRCPDPGRRPDIGYPILNARTYVLDVSLQTAPVGVPGELHIGGPGVGRGYLGRPVETAARFIPDPFSGRPGDRLYKTGDRARYLADGSLEFLGRIDQQIKLRGFRIELGEVEEVLRLHPGVGEAAVAAWPGPGGEGRLVAYVVPRPDGAPADLESDLKAHLRERLPSYMLPSLFVPMQELPRNRSGKLDRAALPSPTAGPASAAGRRPPRNDLERRVAEVWREVLGVEEIGADENFFDLGGHSLLLARVHGRLSEITGAAFPLVDLFTHPTVGTLAEHLRRLLGGAAEPDAAQAIVEDRPPVRTEDTGIAVIGMALRVPGAASLDGFWRNLCEGVESISFFREEELLAAGVPAELLRDPRYVRARGVLEGIELFDAELFRVQPRQAELMDPQQRVFLECVWEALESAGYAQDGAGRSLGVFAGAGVNTYSFRFHQHPEAMGGADLLQVILNNEKDHLATRVSYLLNLEGPGVTVQSSCSTSLVAVHLACQSLLAGDCAMALAGGVSIDSQPLSGYLYQEGGILSPDGHCRAFDAGARGTVSGSGAGVVVLKRLDDAMRDGDTIHAVIRGSAINNDGSLKVGYTAPRAEGQARVIREAQRRAGVRPDEITLIEAHGTGTELGDPIEFAALNQVFRAGTDRVGFCAVTSLKTNVGHLDAAAGVAGLIKTVLSLRHRTIPPSLHFERPNPALGIEGSPFFVNDRLRPWEVEEGPRRAGVSSFGIGGTNVHVVLEEAPTPAPGPSRPWQLLVLSARTETALETATDSLVRHLENSPAGSFADACYTLQAGRRLFPHRRAVVCRGPEEAVQALAARDPKRVTTLRRDAKDLPVTFLFPGQGGQHPGMGRGLYDAEPVFRREIDRCAEILEPSLGIDLREVLYPAEEQAEAAAEKLATMTFAQPTLFVIEHALGRLWTSWLGEPAAMMGHSVGEYAAACLAGVLSVEDALTLVAARGWLMDQTGDGAMTAVPLSEEQLLPRLGDELSIAAINGPARCVVSGPTRAVEDLEARLDREGAPCRRLHIYGAFHSRAVDPILERFAEEVRRVRLHPPRLPYVSSLTGTWIEDAQATDPNFWVRHLRHTVRFDDGLRELWRSTDGPMLEAGPGRALTALVNQHPERPQEREVLSSMRHPREEGSDMEVLTAALGRLWLHGAKVDWAGVHDGETRRRIPLPTYPFERQRYWIDSGIDSGIDIRPAPEPRDQSLWSLQSLQSLQSFEPEAPRLREIEAELQRGMGVEWLSDRAGLEASLDWLCSSLVLDYFRRAGVPLAPGQGWPLDDLRRTLRILPGFHRLLDTLLGMLERDGLLARDGETFLVLPALSMVPPPETLADAVVRQYPEYAGLVRLLALCVSRYGEALSGDIPAIEVLYPQGRRSEALDADESPRARQGLYVELLCRFVAGMADEHPDRELRILEVGAGTGVLTRAVISALGTLSGRRVSYTFTDVGRTFVHAAEVEAERQGLTGLDFRVLDISADLARQGFQEQSYDAVLGLNVVHATPDLRESVGNLKRLLKPGGALALVEPVKAMRWIDLIWGLTEGWWSFADTDLRPASPLAGLDTWERVLREAGLDRVAGFPEGAERARRDFGLILGRRSAAPAEVRQAEPVPVVQAGRPEEHGNAIETRIAEIWRGLLGTTVGLHDNFFEKGADSLAILGLTAKIRDAWKVELPLRQVLETPTVAELAARVDQEIARREAEARALDTSRTLVEIQAGRPDKVPFFTVHAAGGNVLCYYNLARHLGRDRPVYALQAPGLERGEEEIFTRLEDLAAHHAAAVRALRPHGPYLLGGWSAGGTVAFEMAQQLRQAGEEVLLVALMDTYAPQASQGFDEVKMLLWQAWRFGISLTPEDLDGLPGFDARLDRIVDLALERGAIPEHFGRDRARRLLAVETANLQAVLDYRAQPYPGRLSYFRCAEGTDFGEFSRLFPRINEIDHAAGWAEISPRPMPVFDMPGDHASLMDEPAVTVLARHLGECFAEVELEIRVEEPA